VRSAEDADDLELDVATNVSPTPTSYWRARWPASR
jgi:hypothetical protein